MEISKGPAGRHFMILARHAFKPGMIIPMPRAYGKSTFHKWWKRRAQLERNVEDALTCALIQPLTKEKEKKEMKLTRQETLTNHRTMWKILADNPRMQKPEALNKMGVDPGTIMNRCFCCQFAKQEGLKAGHSVSEMHSHKRCKFCPLNWSAEHCEVEGSPYKFWKNSDSVSGRIRTATMIADLPERKDSKHIVKKMWTEEYKDHFEIMMTAKDYDGEDLDQCIGYIPKDGSGLRLIRIWYEDTVKMNFNRKILIKHER